MTDYEFLSADNIPDYLAAHPQLAAIVDPASIEQIDEIGDGNLNLVFRVRGATSSIILKQALPYVRMTGEGWPMTPERAAREAASLQRHHCVAGDSVVRVHQYDAAQYVIAMEDLSDHRVWRDALNEGMSQDGVAEIIGRYVAAVATKTSVLGEDRTVVSGAIAAAQNPDLCIVTEDLVFTEPARDAGRNQDLPDNVDDIRALADDDVFVAAMAEGKWRFMTQAEALVHGDLHTGSIMVRGGDHERADSVKVFDSEFAFYGPIAFDLGMAIANFGFAAARAHALGETERAAWVLELPTRMLDAFAAEFRRLAAGWPDRRLWDDAFVERRLDVLLRETWLFAAAETARRTVGAANVRDVVTIADDAARAKAVRALLLIARALAARWDQPHETTDFATVLRDTFRGVFAPAMH